MRRGLTLIELMVATILTGFIVWMTLDLFSSENRAYTRTRERVRLQSDSREALRLMEQEIRNLGYKSTVAISANRIRSSLNSCNDIWASPASGDSSSFEFVNSTDLSGDQLMFLFHEANNGALASCTNARTIGFRKNGSQLQRYWYDGIDFTHGTWIGLLDSVVSFQLRYGLIALPTDTSLSNGYLQTSTPARWTGGTLARSGTAPTMALSGWTTSRQVALYGNPIDTLDPRHTWEITFSCSPNAALAADMDTSSFRAGFYKSDGSVDGNLDTMAFYPISGSGGSRTVVLQISPGTNSISSRYLGVEGRLKSTAQSGWSMTISDFKARRISRGGYIWKEAPTTVEKKKVRAIGIHLLVKARKTTEEASPGPFDSVALGQSGLSFEPVGGEQHRSYVLFQRIVPVVNNGI